MIETPAAFILRTSCSHSASGTREKWNSPITGSHGSPSRTRYRLFRPIVCPEGLIEVPPWKEDGAGSTNDEASTWRGDACPSAKLGVTRMTLVSARSRDIRRKKTIDFLIARQILIVFWVIW